ncbi:MAG TPA: transposase, partial [Archangium sp.]
FAGRHTLTGVLVAVGGSGPKHHSAYYRLFAAARWSLDAIGLALFQLIVPLLAPGPVSLTLDDTLARKRGLKVFGACTGPCGTPIPGQVEHRFRSMWNAHSGHVEHRFRASGTHPGSR